MRCMPFNKLLRKSCGRNEILSGFYLGPFTFIESKPSFNSKNRKALEAYEGKLICFLKPQTFAYLMRLFGWGGINGVL